MSKTVYDASIVSSRIARLLDEHGAPNTFACSEVFPADPMWLGRFLRDPDNLAHVNRQIQSRVDHRCVSITYDGRIVAR